MQEHPWFRAHRHGPVQQMPYSLTSLSEDILSIAFTKRILLFLGQMNQHNLGHAWFHCASGNVHCDPLDEVIWQQHLGHNIVHTLPFRSHTFGTHYKRKDSKCRKHLIYKGIQ